MLAIIHALSKFRQYLVGEKFVVRRDHNNLKYFLEHKDLNERQQKWVSNIQAYKFDIEFIKAKHNVVADALCKRPSTYSMSEILVDWKSHLIVEYSKNNFACELMDGNIQDNIYSIIDDIIYIRGVPESLFKKKVLPKFHNSPLTGY